MTHHEPEKLTGVDRIMALRQGKDEYGRTPEEAAKLDAEAAAAVGLTKEMADSVTEDETVEDADE